ncbi:response regulator [Nitrosospira sp. NpAV]|uniref:response regulator n=1 Tax=Nitrosospira sp. NpAV TaxID=58133 RepID=UPI0005A0F1AC|nr:response regulator [Nitrosospira sp. NpAV]KIO49142.1 chemotaxis protein CheY [Nitrosospira sp. NpAV]
MSEFESVEILLVEDNASDAELTIRALRKKNMANHLVWLKDGAEALDFLFCTGSYEGRLNSKPKLILLDLKMPKVDGIEVLRRVKADERLKAIPAVIMTSSHEDRDIIESYQLGVNSYLVKPVDFEQFLDVVSRAGLYWLLINKVPEK